MNEFVSKLDSFFPLEFVIVDCCITNDLWVWSEKYFYVWRNNANIELS